MRMLGITRLKGKPPEGSILHGSYGSVRSMHMTVSIVPIGEAADSTLAVTAKPGDSDIFEAAGSTSPCDKLRKYRFFIAIYDDYLKQGMFYGISCRIFV